MRTLKKGSIPRSARYTWCNANADYFLQIESIPGAHDIFVPTGTSLLVVDTTATNFSRRYYRVFESR